MSAPIPCGGCKAGCAWDWVQDRGEPCWGRVEVVDDVIEADGGRVYIHACQGHAGVWDSQPYRPEAVDLAPPKAQEPV